MKQQRPKRKQKSKGHGIRVRCLGFVELAPSRKSMTPFCAYSGPNGETCSSTIMLETVGTLGSVPPIVYMACPLHSDEVRQAVQQFLARLRPVYLA